MAWEKTITRNGAALQTKILAGAPVILTRAAIGEGAVPAEQLADLNDITAPLTGVVVPINPPVRDGDRAVVKTVVTNEGVHTPLTFRQIGVFAQDPDEGEILYLIAQDDAGNQIPPVEYVLDFQAGFDFEILVSLTSDISVVYSPESAVTHAQLEEGLQGVRDGAVTHAQLDVKLQEVKEEAVPSGCILMWSGSAASIPTGWRLCNGANGTPDLRNRFIVGAGSSYSPGNTGGQDSVTLSTTQMPSHSHTFSDGAAEEAGAHTHTLSSVVTSAAGAHTHTVSGMPNNTQGASNATGSNVQARIGSASVTTNTSGDHTHSISGSLDSSGSHTHTVTGSISSAGSGQSHENRPPYYALCFIMKM